MKITKSFLNKFLIWTNSRYNAIKKPQAINNILTGFKDGRTDKIIYETGSYCPCSSMSGGFDYIVDFGNKEIIKCYVGDYGDIKQEFERIKVDNA